MIEKNTAGMNQIVDENFTLIHMTGYVQSKKDWLAKIESENMKYHSAIEMQATVKIAGNHAECILQELLDARIWGSCNTWCLRQTFQFEKRDGKWIIIESIATTF